MTSATTTPISRRTWLASNAAFLAASALPLATTAAAPTPVEVWKDPSCGCCKDWVKHLEEHGFRVTVNDSGNASARARLGIPQKFGSCHTALVDGYALEGHVPASDIRRLLKERPKAVGLAVPGMPVGSPGMDGPEYGGEKVPFDVLLVQANGTATVYRQVR